VNVDLIVVNDFYIDPDNVRNFALSNDFTDKGNFPGVRTHTFFTDDVRQAIEYNMLFAGKITDTFEDDKRTGAFQLTTSYDRSWIDSDPRSMWTGICFLTPHAPVSSGIGFYKHLDSSVSRKRDNNHSGYDYTKWALTDKISNQYNRLVIYRSDLYHADLDHFGDNFETGNLFQTFFFNTEKY